MEKKIIHIYNTERGADYYLKLTDNEITFLEWLDEIGYLDDYTYFDEISELSKLIEF